MDNANHVTINGKFPDVASCSYRAYFFDVGRLLEIAFTRFIAQLTGNVGMRLIFSVSAMDAFFVTV